MRILFLLTQDIESPSGLGRYFPMAKALAALGHKVIIAALHANFEALQQKTTSMDGVTVRYVAPMHVRKQGSVKSYYSPLQLLIVLLRATFQLTGAALSIPSDVILVGKPQPMNGIAGLLGRLFRRSRLVVDCDDYEAGSGHFQNGLQRRLVAFFERSVPRLANIVTTNTRFMSEKLQGWGVPSGRIFYLPNGFDEQRFQKPQENLLAEKRAELGIGERKAVAFIGSLSLVNHPVDLLARAFVRIQQAVPGAVLLIIGGGEDLGKLENLVQELGLAGAVRFCGRVAPEAAPLYYQLANVSVDPVYDDEAARGRCPLKLFESWASETPFVTCDVGDRRSLIGDPPAGLLAAPGDPAALAEAIIRVLQQPSLACELAERGKTRSADYSWSALGRKLAGLLG